MIADIRADDAALVAVLQSSHSNKRRRKIMKIRGTTMKLITGACAMIALAATWGDVRVGAFAVGTPRTDLDVFALKAKRFARKPKRTHLRLQAVGGWRKSPFTRECF